MEDKDQISFLFFYFIASEEIYINVRTITDRFTERSWIFLNLGEDGLLTALHTQLW